MSDIKNTAEAIAAQLRMGILRGELKSKAPLRQDKIALDLGVSKIPVREALVQLKAEGLVTLHTNRGAYVSSLTAKEVAEIYSIRLALESLALETAIPRLSSSDLIHAENVLRLMDIEKDAARWSEQNWEFHAQLYAPAQMPRILRILEPLHLNVARYLVLYLKELGFQETSQAEHYAILQACQAGDTAQALQILKQHLDSASLSLVNFLQAQA